MYTGNSGIIHDGDFNCLKGAEHVLGSLGTGKEGLGEERERLFTRTEPAGCDPLGMRVQVDFKSGEHLWGLLAACRV